MTLRDLTKRQAYNLRRRCEKERKQREKHIGSISPTIWQMGFSAGLRAGLELSSCPLSSPTT